MLTDTQFQGAQRFRELQESRRVETVNGPGSLMSHTTEVREWLPKFVRSRRIRSLADIPCGDHNWMAHVALPKECEYVGYELLPELVEQNRQRYPRRRFEMFNAITDIPPKADCIFCRDFFVHLTHEHATAALDNFRKSGAACLICTTFPNETNQELHESHTGWGWRPLNMEAEPFNLAKPFDGVREVVAGEQWERWLKAYEL